MNNKSIMPTLDLARKLIAEQFPEFAHLKIKDVEAQGHDHRTYRLGDDMLVRIPTSEAYAIKVPLEQEILSQLAPYLSVQIPVPLKMGVPSQNYPYPFSIYKWLNGTSLNMVQLSDQEKERLAFNLAKFLKKLQNVKDVSGPSPGDHNFWRGDHVSVYDQGFREQLAQLSDVIDVVKAMDLWEKARATRWNKKPVWIHGDFAIGNILIKDGKLCAIIDFGQTGMGDPACDLVIAWTYFKGTAREIFIDEMNLDHETWLRAKAWALWKATFLLCQNRDSEQERIIKELI